MAALLAIQEVTSSSRYGYVIVDTAPFGHTLRLFEMPESFQRFLAFLEFVGSRDQVLAAHFGGKATQVGEQPLHDWKRIVRELLTLFRMAPLLPAGRHHESNVIRRPLSKVLPSLS